MRGKANFKSDILPAGKYVAVITETIDSQTKAGDPMIKTKFTITNDAKYTDYWAWDNIIIPKPESKAIKIMGRTRHFLRCIGEPHDGENVSWDSEHWLNKKCIIVTDVELPNEYHFDDKVIIKNYFPLENEETQKTDDDADWNMEK